LESSFANLNVTPAKTPPVITQHPADVTVNPGDTARFSVTVSNAYPAAAYQWQVSADEGSNWRDISDGKTSTLTLSNVLLATNGNQYRCKASNSEGSYTSEYAILTVNGALTIAGREITPQDRLKEERNRPPQLTDDVLPDRGLVADSGLVDKGGLVNSSPKTPGASTPPVSDSSGPKTPGISPPLSADSGSEKSGASKVLVEAIESGVKIDWDKQSGPQYYRVFRSTDPGGEGISVTDFAITSTGFVDVNVKPSTTYYYTVRQVLADADPWKDIPEQRGDPLDKAKAVTTVEKILEPPVGTGEKHFILMEQDDAYMSIDGEISEIDPGRGTAPINRNGRVILPIRAVIEAIGGTVDWDGDTSKITLKTGATEVVMWMDKKDLTINGVSGEMDVAPVSLNDRTMVPVRFAAESSGCSVEWLNATKQIVVVFYMD
jgi:hypothetical protein